ncbi:unnamed protein product [Meloidogyne enterolobii]|uniref:Uncharacterized protein n=1 Tax=Meloidogyne enterolobii TaxID=390850 RepID=A0ACB1AIR3_MELEN
MSNNKIDSTTTITTSSTFSDLTTTTTKSFTAPIKLMAKFHLLPQNEYITIPEDLFIYSGFLREYKKGMLNDKFCRNVEENLIIPLPPIAGKPVYKHYIEKLCEFFTLILGVGILCHFWIFDYIFMDFSLKICFGTSLLHKYFFIFLHFGILTAFWYFGFWCYFALLLFWVGAGYLEQKPRTIYPIILFYRYTRHNYGPGSSAKRVPSSVDIRNLNGQKNGNSVSNNKMNNKMRNQDDNNAAGRSPEKSSSGTWSKLPDWAHGWFSALDKDILISTANVASFLTATPFVEHFANFLAIKVIIETTFLEDSWGWDFLSFLDFSSDFHNTLNAKMPKYQPSKSC